MKYEVTYEVRYSVVVEADSYADAWEKTKDMNLSDMTIESKEGYDCVEL